MRGAEARAIGELAGRTLAGGGAMVRDLHMAAAQRAFTAVGPGGTPARAVHDGVAAAVYGGVRTALSALPRGAGSAFARSAAPQARALAQSPRGSLALAALNAYVGDALVAGGSELAIAMMLRHRGADLPLDPGELLVRVPSASGSGRRRKLGFAIEDGHDVGGVTHFDLLNHPAVYDQIRAWIER